MKFNTIYEDIFKGATPDEANQRLKEMRDKYHALLKSNDYSIGDLVQLSGLGFFKVVDLQDEAPPYDDMILVGPAAYEVPPPAQLIWSRPDQFYRM